MRQKSIGLMMISPLHFLDWVFLGFDAGVVRNVDRTICFLCGAIMRWKTQCLRDG